MSLLESALLEFDLKNRSYRKISLDELTLDPLEKDKVYWIHSDLNQQEQFKRIIEKLQLPDEVPELCYQAEAMPKVIDDENALTIQAECLLSTELSGVDKVSFSSLVVYLTPQFCFTASFEEIPILLEFEKNCQKAIRFAKTPCFILFLMLDNAINDYAKILFNFELLAEKMDSQVRASDENIYNDVMEVKQELLKVKRNMVAMREILMRISGRNISVVSEKCRLSLSNLSNHSHMIVHEIDSIRDMLNSLLDQIDNTLMQRMSVTMNILAAFAAIFLPLSLITGIYGMNFRWIPELEWRYGYFFALSLLFICGLALFWLFKKKKWF